MQERIVTVSLRLTLRNPNPVHIYDATEVDVTKRMAKVVTEHQEHILGELFAFDFNGKKGLFNNDFFDGRGVQFRVSVRRPGLLGWLRSCMTPWLSCADRPKR